ncbi:Ldh family oxidoreductase [Mesorhizobium sp. CAU 1732]|uniref:Ldh family oxidoreductase n=1 Tax=Mesorhizobium sp. CAU 1732 TaxID=3140358 RepID=UPI003261C1DD
MNETTITPDDAHALVVAALIASDTSRENAESVARALVGAELVGQGGHGLRRVAAYTAQARVGKVNGQARPTAKQMRPAAILVDAGHGFAFPALDLAIDTIDPMAREQGIAMAGITRSHHAGVAGLTVEALADRGLVALMFANTPAAMAPWGGRRALFGTDPVAFACPADDAPPIVVDVSLSKVARGKIMAANQSGKPIPEGWATDAEGRPTTDAAAAMNGFMVPLGDAKGTALALMVELLCAGLTGANFAFEQSSLFDAEGAPPGNGQMIIAIDPALFSGNALARFGLMAEAIAGQEGARVPGSRRHAMRQRFMRDGIPVETDLLDQIRRIAGG